MVRFPYYRWYMCLCLGFRQFFDEVRQSLGYRVDTLGNEFVSFGVESDEGFDS